MVGRKVVIGDIPWVSQAADPVLPAFNIDFALTYDKKVNTGRTIMNAWCQDDCHALFGFHDTSIVGGGLKLYAVSYRGYAPRTWGSPILLM